MIEPKFLVRSDEDYHEFNLSYCGRIIKGFKTTHFRKNSKHPARIYAKVFFPPDCPEQFWMYYLVFEVNGKPYQITSITNEAFDTLTRGIEPTGYTSVEFYTIEKHELLSVCGVCKGENWIDENVLTKPCPACKGNQRDA